MSSTSTKSSPPSRPDTGAAHDAAADAEASRQRSLQQALALRKISVPARLSTIVGEQSVDAVGAKFYLDAIKNDAGQPTDPIENMMIEQLVLAHHRIAELHARAAGATSLEAVKIYNVVTARLMGEFRRSSLALKTYRLPPTQKNFSVVHQQNVVAAGQQHVAYVAESPGKESLVVRDEMNGNPDAIDSRINGNGNLHQESEANGADRKNGPMRRPWSAADRQAQRERCQHNQPWLQTTGPRTAAGKARSSANGRRNRPNPDSRRQLRKELAGVGMLLEEMAAMRQLVGSVR